MSFEKPVATYELIHLYSVEWNLSHYNIPNINAHFHFYWMSLHPAESKQDMITTRYD